MFERLLAILALVLIAGVPAGRAQSDNAAEPKVPDRSYKLLREDEDWSFLRDPRLRQDPWDPIKYIRLRSNADDWYMTIGGEAREVWEQIGNDNCGQQPLTKRNSIFRQVFWKSAPPAVVTGSKFGRAGRRWSMARAG